MCWNRNYGLLGCLETQRLHGSFLHGSRLGWLLHSLSIIFLNIWLDDKHHTLSRRLHYCSKQMSLGVHFMSKIIANRFSISARVGNSGLRKDHLSPFSTFSILCHWFHLYQTFCSWLFNPFILLVWSGGVTGDHMRLIFSHRQFHAILSISLLPYSPIPSNRVTKHVMNLLPVRVSAENDLVGTQYICNSFLIHTSDTTISQVLC